MPHPDSLENKKLTTEQRAELSDILSLPLEKAYLFIRSLPNSSIIFYSFFIPSESQADQQLKERFRSLCESEELQSYWLEKIKKNGLSHPQKTLSAYFLFLGICATKFAVKIFATPNDRETLRQWLQAIQQQFHAFHAYLHLTALTLMDLHNNLIREKELRTVMLTLGEEAKNFHGIAGITLLIAIQLQLAILDLSFLNQPHYALDGCKASQVMIEEALICTQYNEEDAKLLQNYFPNTEQLPTQMRFYEAVFSFWQTPFPSGTQARKFLREFEERAAFEARKLLLPCRS